MCKVHKTIAQYRFKNFYCRLCTYLHRYRFGHTKERFLEHAKRYNLRGQSSIRETVTPIEEHEQSPIREQSPISETVTPITMEKNINLITKLSDPN